jgi:hypothetical protein
MPVSPSVEIRSPTRAFGQAKSTQGSYSLSPGYAATSHIDTGAREPVFSTWLANIENASLSRLHTSATESILAWPHFDCYGELRNANWDTSASIFNLEQSRSVSSTTASLSMLPFPSRVEIESIVEAFQTNINFWYPTLTKGHLDSLIDKVMHSMLGDDCESCLALLVMALGCACDATTSAVGSYDGVDLREGTRFNSERHLHRQKIGRLYFDCALSRLYSAYQEVSTSALHCLLFTA